IDIPMKHCSNSAGIIDLKEADMDAVRAGISIYGMYPSEEVDKRLVPLYPVLSLKSRIVFLKTIEPGTAVSYGGTFVAEKPMRIATIPVGYGDGYPRNLSGKGSVLIRGRRAAILGRICMDQFMVDVTEIPDVCEDDLVTLIGEDRTERISVEEIAETCGGFHYEIVCDIGKRVPRVYKKNGRIVGTKDYFDDVYEGFEDI
ncbi:MAG: alanine racemase, partial [Clostridiaceae bacterium]|nr:alanine racemase [Clostridiaceae bacterium]